MKTSLNQVLDAVRDERAHQHERFPSHAHDVRGWITILQDILGKAEACTQAPNNSALHEIRQLVAVGVGCLEEHGAPLRGETYKEVN